MAHKLTVIISRHPQYLQYLQSTSFAFTLCVL